MRARKPNHVSWKIGGEAGFGIMSTGEMFARMCMRAGLNVFSYPEYPSLIRGGHNTVQVYASTEEISAHRTQVDLLVALNRETVDRHLDELNPDGVVLYDSSDETFKKFNPLGPRRRKYIGLPLEDLARNVGGQKLMRNTVALGATCALLDVPTAHLNELIADAFLRKGPAVVELNKNVLMAGYHAVKKQDRRKFRKSITSRTPAKTEALFTGNDALALGAIQAGCQLYSAYPMTPASSILHFLAEHGPQYGMIVRHAEDEIAAINHAVGAAYAGVRAMTGSAGGGFALMTETIGLSAMTEVGIVVIEAQRGGPSTGLPTWTEQADLRQVLHASQGDFPRIVLAPGTHAECFYLIQLAFNLAEVYQSPVIVMTDKYLAEGLHNVKLSDLKALPIQHGKIAHPPKRHGGMFARYRTDIADGVSPRTLPGVPNGLFLANSDEHDAFGYSNEEQETRVAQMNRRARKARSLAKEIVAPRRIGPPHGRLTVVTWGSSAGPVEDALHILRTKYRIDANAYAITMVAPFPAGALSTALKRARKTAMVEANQGGQMEGWIRQQTGRSFDYSIRRFDGRPFDPEELAEELLEIARRR